MITPEQLEITELGPREIVSPIPLSKVTGDGIGDYVDDRTRVLAHIELQNGEDADVNLHFEKAGPRSRLYFRPQYCRAAIVTCGGLCPGLNNVIRSVHNELYYHYGVKDILGIRNGFQGLNPDYGLSPVELDPEMVSNIHKLGGTILSSSRGPQDPRVMVNYLCSLGVNMLFCVGGDGTQRGAQAISEEALRQGAPLAVVGIPKTIDNDIHFVQRSFGFATALEKAKDVLDGAHVEAKGAPNGLAIVKLMGRNAGFIAAGATIASQEVNCTLIPELPFDLEGEDGLLAFLKKRIVRKKHAVLVVAEGAGQDLFDAVREDRDASGNAKLHDIGPFLQERIKAYFAEQGVPLAIKYFDPSYYIRSVPANSADSVLCDQMARMAVHAAAAGKTGVLIGYLHNYFVHVPIALAVAHKKHLNPEGDLWMAVVASTGQPARLGGITQPMARVPDDLEEAKVAGSEF
ncbi:MAG: ATP-dependent 6-phosphofructokinase [Bryobacterales bacterium]|nr:ATP-dependent 6-phosphofructokinase [Bryobacterales bacterium]